MKYLIGNEDAQERYSNCESAAIVVRAGKPDAKFEAAARECAAKFGQTRLFAVAPVDASPLEIWKHLAVKLTFNTLSTGTMAASGRVAGNWMSWVSISNKKLIDRGIRLIAELGHVSYEEAALRLFAADDWIEITPDSVRPRAAAIALGGSAEGYVAIDHPNIAHSRYLPTDACLRSIRAGTNYGGNKTSRD